METRTVTRLAEITDEGLFERVATAVLRLLPDYEGLAHTGINADGKTRKSPVDGLRFHGESGCHFIAVHHTITAASGLERKWLLDPATVRQRAGGRARPTPGDVIKSIDIILAERMSSPGLSATLVLTTNQEPDEALLRKVVATGRSGNVTIDIWTRSRIAGWLDTDPRGQIIRRKLLGIEEELLSRELLKVLSARSIAAFDPGDDPRARISRGLGGKLALERGPITFVVAPSGSGKTVAAHMALQQYHDAGGIALVVPHAVVEQTLTFEQAVLAILRQLQPTLSPSESVLALFSEEDPLMVLVEDISRSTQPQRLVEKLAGWGPSDNNSIRLPWRMLCPVWPHLLGGIQGQFRDRVSTMSLRPDAMSNEEAGAAVQAQAKARGVALDAEQARVIAAALGDDPLMIALNREWSFPRPEQVIGKYVEDALSRIQQDDGSITAELRVALLELGTAMLIHRSFDPGWDEVLDWGLPEATLARVRAVSRHADILRLDGASTAIKVRFRHDRVRDWLLVEAAIALKGHDQLSDDLLADPALAEIVGALLVRTKAPEALTSRVLDQGALALFQGLRLAVGDSDTSHRLAAAAMTWLSDPKNLGSATETLRWQAMATLENVAGDFVVELTRQFPVQSPMTMLARIRNGDVTGGIELCAQREIHTVAAWTAGPLAAARPRWGATLANDLIRYIDADTGETEKKRWALIECAGMLADPALAPALQRLWDRDAGRDQRLAVYLWGFARCATHETAAILLGPVCAAWAGLSEERVDNMSSPRDDLASDGVRNAFERAIPVGALEYFFERAREPDLVWQIEYMLHGIDHPEAVLFQVERGSERLGKGQSYTFNNQAREHWRRSLEGYGSPMSPETRAPLLELWRAPEDSANRRRAAFDLWAAARGPNDLEVLRAEADDTTLGDRILRERLQRGDQMAIPALIPLLDGEGGLRWWFYARYVWSSALYEALDRALAREAAKPPPDENQQYEIGSTLTRVLMRLPVIDAERLLLRYWDRLGSMVHFVQAALFVATSELLSRADTVVQGSAEPKKLFEHIISHFGVRMSDEAGITREAQIRALAPYFRYLRPSDLEDLGQLCDENGWYDLRRQMIDPSRDQDKVESPDRFRHILDGVLERGHSSFIDHDVDNLLKADVAWPALATVLRDWLSVQTSRLALEAADHAIRHAGDHGDADILEAWNGEDRLLVGSKKADLDFALRRRERSCR